jgi:hypothetical protein
LIACLRTKDIKVTLFTSRPHEWHDEIESLNTVTGQITRGKLALATDNAAEVIPNADMILFTIPSNAIKDIFGKIKNYISEGTIIGFIPGTGGKEYLCSDLLKKSCIIWGTQRVPSGTSIVEYGKKVHSLGNRKDLRIAAMPRDTTGEICVLMHELLDITTVPLNNYLCVTLTPSNPILHTSRLYSILKEYRIGDMFDEKISLYKKWDDASSRILIGCDTELQNCCKKLNRLDLTAVLSLKVHYEIEGAAGKDDFEKMTRKISSLPFLKDSIPMIPVHDKYIPDLQSRYFLEDYPYGLCIVKSFCVICGIESPNIDIILRWYSNLFNKEYFIGNNFTGRDLLSLPLPQNYGIKTPEDIYTFYNAC